jgi:hypothetical protein
VVVLQSDNPSLEHHQEHKDLRKWVEGVEEFYLRGCRLILDKCLHSFSNRYFDRYSSG